VPRSQADASVLPVYDLLFGDRDPVAQPGTATGTPGDWWTVFALDPNGIMVEFCRDTPGFTPDPAAARDALG
jgi:hypothetical protein